MIFDTYHDRQNGFIFGTNADRHRVRRAGAQRRRDASAAARRAASAAATAAASGAGVNVNWDGTWEVKTQLTETGWNGGVRHSAAHAALRPAAAGLGRQLHAEHRAQARAGLLVADLAHLHARRRLSSAGELRDLNVPAPRDFKLMPYAIGSANRNFTPDRPTTDHRGDWGIDGKIGVTSSMTLDLTYNTDFAQVEVDEQQINLTRFNLLFPEKRPFFLENRGLFAVGKSGEIDLFFSRRIGIGDNGALVPIQGGARLTGKASGVNVGLLNMQTERVGPDAREQLHGGARRARICATARASAAFSSTAPRPASRRARQLEPHLRRRRPAGASARRSPSAASRRGRRRPG